jgi:WD40 repeat protein
MATSGVDAKLKIWDLRNYKCLNEYRTSSNGASALAFSQKKLLAASYRDIVEVIFLKNEEYNQLAHVMMCGKDRTWICMKQAEWPSLIFSF